MPNDTSINVTTLNIEIQNRNASIEWNEVTSQKNQEISFKKVSSIAVPAQQVGSQVVVNVEIDGLHNGDQVKIDMNYTLTSVSTGFTADDYYHAEFEVSELPEQN